MAGRVRVLVVDDSALVRKLLCQGLGNDPRLEVVGTAADPYQARDRILELRPDVMTLDLEMPRMGGLEFIKLLMEHYPLPIVVVSTLTQRRSRAAIQALELGAVDVVGKPDGNLADRLPKMLAELADKVYEARFARLGSRPATAPGANGHGVLSQAIANKIIAIGASTGGTEAIRVVLQGLPSNIPGILIVQHMPIHFTRAFADRLDSICPNLEVREAGLEEEVLPGQVLIAPGDKHLLLRRVGDRYQAQTRSGPRVCRHLPSVQVLFDSVAQVAGADAVGVLLTGMGSDGAEGLLRMRQAGAHTIAQDEQSCVVYGMPKAAVDLGAAERVTPLDLVSQTILGFLR